MTAPNGQVFDGHGDERAGVPVPAPAAGRARKRTTSVDLAAWARGEAEHDFDEIEEAITDYLFERYIFAEIEKIMDARRGPLRDRHDALMFLIREGIVDAADVDVDIDDHDDA